MRPIHLDSKFFQDQKLIIENRALLSHLMEFLLLSSWDNVFYFWFYQCKICPKLQHGVTSREDTFIVVWLSANKEFVLFHFWSAKLSCSYIFPRVFRKCSAWNYQRLPGSGGQLPGLFGGAWMPCQSLTYLEADHCNALRPLGLGPVEKMLMFV